MTKLTLENFKPIWQDLLDNTKWFAPSGREGDWHKSRMKMAFNILKRKPLEKVEWAVQEYIATVDGAVPDLPGPGYLLRLIDDNQHLWPDPVPERKGWGEWPEDLKAFYEANKEAIQNMDFDAELKKVVQRGRIS